MCVTTQGYSFALANGGHKFHKLKDGSSVAQCGFKPTGKRGKWTLVLKELTGDERTCLNCLLRESV